MAKVRKARYIYQDGVYYEVGGNDDEILARLNNMILVQDDEPTSPDNKIWIKETDTPIEIPEMSDIADFVSFSEDQTSRTDAEKAQARSNIGVPKWELVWVNASPDSQFAAQTIPLTFNPDDEVGICASTGSASHLERAYGIVSCKVYQDGDVEGANVAVISWPTDSTAATSRKRNFTVTTTGIACSVGTEKGATDNKCIRPLEIYVRRHAFA